MERYFSVVCLIALLVGLCGCGEQPASSAAASEGTNPFAEAALLGEDYEPTEIEAEWSDVDLQDDAYGWIFSEADFSTLGLNTSQRKYQRAYLDESRMEHNCRPVVLEAVDGSILCEVWVDAPLDNTESITAVSFGEDDLWIARRYRTIIDEETGEFTAEFTLERWGLDGSKICSIPVDSNLGAGPEGILYLALLRTPDNDLILKHSFGMYKLDENGDVILSLPSEEDDFGICYGADGTMFLLTNSSTAITAMDWDTFTEGEALVSVGYDEIVLPGGGEYEFLLSGSQYLKGIDLDHNIVSTILKWNDVGITQPSDIYYLDENTLLVGVYSTFSGASRLLRMDRVPVTEIPEQPTIHIAVGVAPSLAEMGIQWQDCSGDLDEMISDFNLSSEYQIEVSTFSDSGELNLLMLGETPPDMIWWGDVEMETTLQSYSRNGYLQDLTPYFEEEEDLALKNFFPQIIESVTSSDGGIYAMPTQVLLESLMGRQDLVGTTDGWSYEEFFAAVDRLPEGVPIASYCSGSALLVYIRHNMGEFVDLNAGTCDFAGETFQWLLALCKTYFPADADDIQYFDDELSAAYSGEVMTTSVILPSSPAYYCSMLAEYRQAGMTIAGFPGIGGNGAVMELLDACSLTTAGSHTDGAWQFMKLIYGSDYQSCWYVGSHTVRSDCLEKAARSYGVLFSIPYEEEHLMEALELYQNAAVSDSVDGVLIDMVIEESEAYFSGTKTAMEVGELLNSRIRIYLSEQLG